MGNHQALALLRRPGLGPALILTLHLFSLGLFVRGFLLTRVHLPQRSVPPPAVAANRTEAPYDRMVWLMIDALRYDFVVADGRYSCSSSAATCHQGHMPYLTELSRQQGAARSFMFIADAPTTTTQRLKSLATGGLPSFFDISNSFTAREVADDNLLDQLAASGRRLVFMGDTTWQALFPHAWAWSRPYPCFNVRDLHTVDDGVWQHLLPALRDPGTWDGLLVAHYLGVDHCGHTHGVSSPEMTQKLRQMDDHVRQVIESLLDQAGPGGAYQRTLLVVSGDHGQTLGGDHGGGSPEEVDSALVAVDIAALRALSDGRDKSSSPPEPATRGLAAPAPCRASCSCGLERNQCAPDLPQMDLTPTLCAMLGVPVPFGNLGKLSAELWQLTAAHVYAGSGRASIGDNLQAAAEAAWERSLLDALMGNAKQVHTYLNTYAATPGTAFSRTALRHLNTLYSSLGAPIASADGGSDMEPLVSRCYAYLEAAAEVARQQWTQFHDLPMALGLALFAATLAFQAAAAFGSSSGVGAGRGYGWQHLQAWQLAARWGPGHWLWVPTFHGWLAIMALMHSLGIFSFFYLLSEGTMVCYLVAASTAMLALATGRAAWAAGQQVRGVVVMGIMAMRSNALMALLGVAHHTGQGFWTRLTVHDAQPAGEVERGLQSTLARVQAVGTVVMARTQLDQLSPALLSVAQHSLLCTLPVLVLAVVMGRMQRGAGNGRNALLRLLPLLAFASTAAYLQLEEAEKQGLLEAQSSFQSLALQQLRPRLPSFDAIGRAQLAVAAAALRPLALAWPAAAQLGSLLAGMPLRVLLPHVTYALCGAAAGMWLLHVASRRLRGASASTALAQVVLALLLQVSDRRAALILLLGLLQLIAVARLMARRAQLLPDGKRPAGVVGEAAVLVALISAQMFYATGHLCEFAGLQYTAGFIGSEEFHLWRSGALLALNTFGAMLLVLLALPAITQHIRAAAGEACGGKDEGAGPTTTPTEHAVVMHSDNSATNPAEAAETEQEAPVGPYEAGVSLCQALLIAGLVRSAAALCATLSAGLQRRHLYAWALFAPKFAFEACFMLLTDLTILLCTLL